MAEQTVPLVIVYLFNDTPFFAWFQLLIYATCLKAQLQALHAEGLCQSKQPFNTKKTEHHPEGTAALGWLVSVECPADGQQYQGQLIAYAAETGLHHVLYVDGEDEWLSIGVEQIDWIRHIENPMPAGIKPGKALLKLSSSQHNFQQAKSKQK